MKRLIRADAAILKPEINLDKEIAISAIKAKAVNFKDIYNYDEKNAQSTALFGMVSTDLSHIIEFYVYLDNKNERWLSIITAPINKIRDGSISQSDLSVGIQHIDKISMGNIMNAIDNSNVLNNNGERLQFTENSINEFRNSLKNIE